MRRWLRWCNKAIAPCGRERLAAYRTGTPLVRNLCARAYRSWVGEARGEVTAKRHRATL
jgi:hypothetical protein